MHFVNEGYVPIYLSSCCTSSPSTFNPPLPPPLQTGGSAVPRSLAPTSLTSRAVPASAPALWAGTIVWCATIARRDRPASGKHPGSRSPTRPLLAALDVLPLFCLTTPTFFLLNNLPRSVSASAHPNCNAPPGFGGILATFGSQGAATACTFSKARAWRHVPQTWSTWVTRTRAGSASSVAAVENRANTLPHFRPCLVHFRVLLKTRLSSYLLFPTARGWGTVPQ